MDGVYFFYVLPYLVFIFCFNDYLFQLGSLEGGRPKTKRKCCAVMRSFKCAGVQNQKFGLSWGAARVSRFCNFSSWSLSVSRISNARIRSIEYSISVSPISKKVFSSAVLTRNTLPSSSEFSQANHKATGVLPQISRANPRLFGREKLRQDKTTGL